MERLTHFYDALRHSLSSTHCLWIVPKLSLFLKLFSSLSLAMTEENIELKGTFLALQRNLSYLFSYFSNYLTSGWNIHETKLKKNQRHAALSPSLNHIS